MKKIVLIYCLCIGSNTYTKDSFDLLKTSLQEVRFAYYKENRIPSQQQIAKIFKKTQNVSQKDDKQLLSVLYGILMSEIILYSKNHTNMLSELENLYKNSRKSILKSKIPNHHQKLGDWALLLTQLNRKKERNYALDARTHYLYTLKYDKNNLQAKVGLGQWWAWNVITGNNREMNHSFSQAETYLSDTMISLLQDSLDKSNKFLIVRIYIIRSLLRLRMLKTKLAFEDLQKSSQIFPNFSGNTLIRNLYKQSKVQ